VTREAYVKNIIITKSVFNVIIYPRVDTTFISSDVRVICKVKQNDNIAILSLC
jgi:hypothetical protein